MTGLCRHGLHAATCSECDADRAVVAPPYSGPPPGRDDFDNMLHALGRTRDALGWRNHYCTEVGGPTAQRFEALGWWTKSKTINEGRDAIYRVNARGKAALKAYFGANRLDEFAEMVRQVEEGPNQGE